MVLVSDRSFTFVAGTIWSHSSALPKWNCIKGTLILILYLTILSNSSPFQSNRFAGTVARRLVWAFFFSYLRHSTSSPFNTEIMDDLLKYKCWYCNDSGYAMEDCVWCVHGFIFLEFCENYLLCKRLGTLAAVPCNDIRCVDGKIYEACLSCNGKGWCYGSEPCLVCDKGKGMAKE
jgi:hypothetical protein